VSAGVRKILVTGANGFIGRRLVARLAEDPQFADAQITACDIIAPALSIPRVESIVGDLADDDFLARVTEGAPDLVFHLASILSGEAEANYARARRVNIEATLSLFEALRHPDVPPRVVFASSKAVFGPPLPDRVDDTTQPFPTMVYGAHKRMMEIALEQFSASGWIDGIAIRLPGVFPRADANARQRSAFISLIFRAVARGEDMVLPVSPDGTTWIISMTACIDAFVHAALVPPERLNQRRAMNLPAQNVAFGDLVAALHAAFPQSRSRIDYVPQADIVAQFTQPPLATPLADSLGFTHDGDLQTLIRRALVEAQA
jgi:nucleoside-diphosphate-sugar epimerase